MFEGDVAVVYGATQEYGFRLRELCGVVVSRVVRVSLTCCLACCIVRCLVCCLVYCRAVACLALRLCFLVLLGLLIFTFASIVLNAVWLRSLFLDSMNMMASCVGMRGYFALATLSLTCMFVLSIPPLKWYCWRVGVAVTFCGSHSPPRCIALYCTVLQCPNSQAKRQWRRRMLGSSRPPSRKRTSTSSS